MKLTLLVTLLLLGCGPDLSHVAKVCDGVPGYGSVWLESADADCGHVAQLASTSKALLVASGVWNAGGWEYATARTPLVVRKQVSWSEDGSDVMGHCGPGLGIELNRDMSAWLHEEIHLKEEQDGNLLTVSHDQWDARGYLALADFFWAVAAGSYPIRPACHDDYALTAAQQQGLREAFPAELERWNTRYQHTTLCP